MSVWLIFTFQKVACLSRVKCYKGRGFAFHTSCTSLHVPGAGLLRDLKEKCQFRIAVFNFIGTSFIKLKHNTNILINRQDEIKIPTKKIF